MILLHGAYMTIDMMEPLRSRSRMRGISAPTLIVLGDSDSIRLEHAVELFRLRGGGVMGDLAAMRASQLAVLPGTSHFIPPGSAVLDRAECRSSTRPDQNASRRMLAPVAPCEHVEEARADWGPVSEPVCEDCARAGETGWVSLRQCLTCGHVGCCDSSPGRHATGHHRESGHPTVQSLQPGQDWVWCYVDELTMRHVDGEWVEVDLFYEAGIGYMRDHLEAGGEPAVDESFVHGKGFPLGRWVAEMRRRNAAGELTTDQRSRIEELPGWRWNG